MIIKKWTGTIIKVYRSIKDNKGDVDMATISFDRDIVLNKQASNKLLRMLSEEGKEKIEIEDINVEEKLARGKELLKHLFSR